MHSSKRKVLAVAAALCFALLCVGAISASAVPNGDVASNKATKVDKDAAYKAATDNDPHLPLTPFQQRMRAQKMQAATTVPSGTPSTESEASSLGAAGDSESSSSAIAVVAAAAAVSDSLTPNQNPQKRSYWCGPATVNEALGQLGVWVTQEQLAIELNTTSAGTGWSAGGTSPTGFPVPDVMNAHQSKNYYIPESVPNTPSDGDVSSYKTVLMHNISTIRAPVIGDAWTTKYSEFHLVGHPSTTIFHWFDIYGYRTSGGTTYTKYEDSVHGVSPSVISWAPNVPAYSELPSHQIAHIVGGRGYVW